MVYFSGVRGLFKEKKEQERRGRRASADDFCVTSLVGALALVELNKCYIGGGSRFLSNE